MEHLVLEVGESISIKVYAKAYYSNHALIVEKGQKYRFEADEEDLWKDFFICCNAEGFRNILLRKRDSRVREVRCFYLCGTIGMDDEYNFPIGLETEYSVVHSGDLHFFANDKKNSRFANKNNFGCIDLNVIRLE